MVVGPHQQNTWLPATRTYYEPSLTTCKLLLAKLPGQYLPHRDGDAGDYDADQFGYDSFVSYRMSGLSIESAPDDREGQYEKEDHGAGVYVHQRHQHK